MRSRSRGFTLAELLIVVAIIGILSGMAFYSLRTALERARQRRSMADMRAVALAINSYGVDHVRVPSIADGEAVELLPYLNPTYLKTLPASDGWHRPFHYMGSGLDYTVWCTARDGLRQGELVLGPTTDMDHDIVMNNGIFVQWPDGMQIE